MNVSMNFMKILIFWPPLAINFCLNLELTTKSIYIYVFLYNGYLIFLTQSKLMSTIVRYSSILLFVFGLFEFIDLHFSSILWNSKCLLVWKSDLLFTKLLHMCFSALDCLPFPIYNCMPYVLDKNITRYRTFHTSLTMNFNFYHILIFIMTSCSGTI